MTEPATPQPHTRVATDTDAEQILHRMGLRPSDLTRACVEGLQDAVNQHSPFEPAIALGVSIWAKIVGSLRNHLDGKGWTQHDIANAPRSVSPDGATAIAAIGGDPHTAETDATPSNAHAKGPRFINEVKNNAKGSSALRYIQCPLDLGLSSEDARFANLRTWVLLYFWDRGSNELRMELSLPINCADGIVTQWETRIILPTQELSGDIDLPGSDTSAPTQDVHFDVTAVS